LIDLSFLLGDLLIGIGEQAVNGSPVWPSLQVQIGTWLMTWQLALVPHDPGQGSRQRWRTQACWLGQSALSTHSGRQFGGAPTWSGKQEHAGTPLSSWHCEFGPQGDGTQDGGGGVGAGGGGNAKITDAHKHSLPVLSRAQRHSQKS